MYFIRTNVLIINFIDLGKSELILKLYIYTLINRIMLIIRFTYICRVIRIFFFFISILENINKVK